MRPIRGQRMSLPRGARAAMDQINLDTVQLEDTTVRCIEKGPKMDLTDWPKLKGASTRPNSLSPKTAITYGEETRVQTQSESKRVSRHWKTTSQTPASRLGKRPAALLAELGPRQVRMRILGGDTFSFWPRGRCQVWRCQEGMTDGQQVTGQEIWSRHCHWVGLI